MPMPGTLGATLVVAHACRRPCRFPDGLVRVGTRRHEGVGRHLVRRKRSRAGFGMGDREGRPYAGLVAELFGCRGDPCGRPRLSSPMPVSRCLVRVGTRRHEGVGRHLVRRKRSRAGFGMGDRKGRPYAGLVAELFGCRGDPCGRPRLSSPMPVSRWPRSGRYGTPQGRGTPRGRPLQASPTRSARLSSVWAKPRWDPNCSWGCRQSPREPQRVAERRTQARRTAARQGTRRTSQPARPPDLRLNILMYDKILA